MEQEDGGHHDLAPPLSSADLRVFDAVVVAGSFGRAAARLLVSQPSVSERIAGIESRLGARLFDRGGRGVTLTAAGEALVPFARREATLLRDASAAVRRTATVPRLVIGVHSTFTADIAPVVLSALADLPRRIRFRDAHTDRIVALVAKGEVDVGFVAPATLPRGITGHRLPPDRFIAVAAPGHPLVRRGVGSVAAVAGAEIASNLWGAGADALADLLVANQGRPERWRSVPDPRTAITLAVHNGHVAFVPRASVLRDLADGRLVELDLDDLPDWTVELEVIHHATTADEAVSRVVAAVADRPR